MIELITLLVSLLHNLLILTLLVDFFILLVVYYITGCNRCIGLVAFLVVWSGDWMCGQVIECVVRWLNVWSGDTLKSI